MTHLPMTTEEDDAHDPVADLRRSGRACRVVLAEDLPEHAEAIVGLLRRLRPSWHVCAIARNADQLMQAVDDHAPDLLLLDVHLIGGKSIDALQGLPYAVPIVFVSGDPSFAIDAYEHAAVDYLLKPVRASRLQRALNRFEAMGRPAAPRPPAEAAWFTARKGDATVVVHHDEVVYLQAQAKFTRAVLRDGEVLLRRGLGQVEQQLPPSRFVRIHRGTLINIEHAGTLVRDDIGRLKLQMRGRTEWLHVSKAFERHFKSP
jgi:DNA-binding LytR/AlgR family response regulator